MRVTLVELFLFVMDTPPFAARSDFDLESDTGEGI